MPPPMSMPIYYTVNGQYSRPVPSSGMFGSMGKQSTATNKQDAEAKAKTAMEQNKLQLPEGAKMWGSNIENGSFVVQFQNGGKRRKTRRGASKSRSRTRKLRGKRSRR